MSLKFYEHWADHSQQPCFKTLKKTAVASVCVSPLIFTVPRHPGELTESFLPAVTGGFVLAAPELSEKALKHAWLYLKM